MVEPAIEYRGWKEICALLNVRDKRTAKKILQRLNLLAYDGAKPVLSVDLYRDAVMQRARKPRSETQVGNG